MSGVTAAKLSSNRTIGSGLGDSIGVDLRRHLGVGNDGAVEVLISDLYDPEPLMYEHPIRLIGQVDLRTAEGGLAITRLRVFCCAADATPRR